MPCLSIKTGVPFPMFNSRAAKELQSISEGTTAKTTSASMATPKTPANELTLTHGQSGSVWDPMG